MSNIIQSVNQERTMSSREIAELTGKEHKHVLRDCLNMFCELEIDHNGYAHNWTHPQNKQTYIEYLLTRDLVDTLVTGYSIKLRHAVMKKWRELESQVSKPQLPDFTDPVAAARAWANEVEAKQIAQEKLAIAAPKAEYFDKVADRSTLLNATQVGQKVNMSAVVMNRHLDELNVYSKTVKRCRVFQQWFIDKGLGELKQTETGHSQAMFTIKGEQWIVMKFTSEGLI